MVKTITIEDKKIIELIEQKNDLVKDGRNASKEIEKLDKQIEKNVEKQEKITKAVDCQELFDKGVKIQEEINQKMEELNDVSKEIRKIKIDSLPEELVSEYKELNKQKEAEEKKRNKVALKIQF